MQGTISVAAATAVVGYDLFQDQTWRVSAELRRLRAIACAGSAAAGDFYADIYIGERRVGRIYNLATGWPTMDHKQELTSPDRALVVPPGETVSAIVGDAPATNPINMIVFM